MSFEDFELSVNIAAGCDVTPVNGEKNSTTINSCGWYDGFDFLFTSGVDNCKSKTTDDGSSYGCYHVPIDSKNLFSS